MKAVSCANVTKTYRSDSVAYTALRDVSFDIEQGEFVSIMGPSGSGKSTLLHLIGALDRPSAGTVTIAGRNIAHLSENERATLRATTLGFVFQSFNLIPRLTVLENVALPLWFAGKDQREERAHKVLDDVGLGERRGYTPSQLSGGQRQRVAIARALVNEPQIIVADEPTGNLDTKTGSDIIRMLADINAHGTTLIIVTHDEAIAAKASRTITIRDGRIAGDAKGGMAA